MAFLPLVGRRPENHTAVMHPFQIDTLAKQRWDELVAAGAAARHNRKRRQAQVRRARSALFGLLARRPMGRTPGRDGRPRKVATLP